MEASWDLLLQQLAAKLMPQLLEQQHAAPKYFHSRWVLGTVLMQRAWRQFRLLLVAPVASACVLHLPCCSLASLCGLPVLLYT